MNVTIGSDSYEKMWSDFNKSKITDDPPKDAISVRQYATKYKQSIDKVTSIFNRAVNRGELTYKVYRVLNHNGRSCNVKFYQIVKVAKLRRHR